MFKLLEKLPMRSLRVDIMTACLVLLFTTTITIISYTYKRNSDLILEFADDTIDSVSQIASFQLKKLIRDAESAVQTGSSILNDPIKATPETTDLIDFMFAMLAYNPHIENYYFGLKDGTFLEISRSPNTKGERDDYRIRFINQKATPPKETFIYIDNRGALLYKEEKTNIDYDPRTRPWFIKSNDRTLPPNTIYEIEPKHKYVNWTDIYLFESPFTGVSVSDAVHDYNGKWIGIVGADVTLEGLSKFLTTQKIGEHGKEIIVSRQGTVIASPNHHKKRLELGLKRELTLKDLNNPVFEKAFEIYLREGKHSFTFEYDETEYLGSFSPFNYQNFPNDWLILIVVPINDFLGDIIRTHRDNLLISGGIVLFGILAIIFLSREISKPLIKLAYQIDEIKQFHLDNPIDTTSSIREIYLISNATKRMQEAIQTFSFYVPKELVQKLITQGIALELGGKTKEMTVFFSDIVDFTTISEEISPDQLMLQLSEYLDEISKVLLAHQGTIDKYIGDNVMAFWGAPEDDEQHSIHACEAALECRLAIYNLNRKWKKEDKPPFLTKFGIHRDQVIVGNIGTHERRNYTIIGDGVNLTARLERVNRVYHTDIIVSEELWEKVKEHFIGRPIDIIAVKGKKQCVKIYELMGMVHKKGLEPSQERVKLAEKFTYGFELYLKRDWEKALKTFQECGPDDFLSTLYIKRCKELLRNPPSSWDPVRQV